MPCLLTAGQDKLHASEYSLLQYADSNQRPQIPLACAGRADVAGRCLVVDVLVKGLPTTDGTVLLLY